MQRDVQNSIRVVNGARKGRGGITDGGRGPGAGGFVFQGSADAYMDFRFIIIHLLYVVFYVFYVYLQFTISIKEKKATS